MKNKNSGRGWITLLVFTLVAGVTQMLWLNFAPLISRIQSDYGVDELTAALLILVFPALYVVLSIPAGVLIDRKGYRFTVGLGAVITAVFSCLRIFEGGFAILLIGQIGIAVGQPFVVNGISKLVADWFTEERHALTTGLGTVGMFIGMALGMALTPELVKSSGMRYTMIVFAIISVAAAALFLVGARENEPSAEPTSSIATLFRDRNLVLLFILSFLALGFFNGLTTWLELILKPLGIKADDAGLIGGLLIIGGIAGSAILPALSDRLRRRKPFLIFCCLVGAALVYPLCTIANVPFLYGLGAATGFFFLPGYALLLAMTEEAAGPARAGSAAGILMMAGNAGGVVVAFLMEIIKGDSPTWISAVIFMIVLMAFAGVLTFFTKETFGSHSIGTGE